jgi:hypothetical protein
MEADRDRVLEVMPLLLLYGDEDDDESGDGDNKFMVIITMDHHLYSVPLPISKA